MFRKMNMLILVLVMGLLFISLPSANALDFNIIAGPGLASNAAALAAFNRGAAQWTRYINDPITVTINADITDMGSTTIIGSTSPVFLDTGYNLVRNHMVADAAPYWNNAIVASLPTAAQAYAWVPPGFGLTSNIMATKANLKAMGFLGLDAEFGATDATITFNSGFSFAYNHALIGLAKFGDLTATKKDFETVAAHEIGHALGFISAVDVVDYYLSHGDPVTVSLTPLDLFRFGPADLPTTLYQFTNNARMLHTGEFSESYFSDTNNVYAFSTGMYTGDGRQASHWKADELTGSWIGLLDPTLASGVFFDVAASDFRALDLIGYDLEDIPQPGDEQHTPIPLPPTVLLLGSGLLGLAGWRRLRKG